MFTMKSVSREMVQAREDYEKLREENTYLRERIKALGDKNEKLALALQRLLKFHGVWGNYVQESRWPPYIPRLDLDRLDADLEAVYAVTKADAARARLTKTEEETEE